MCIIGTRITCFGTRGKIASVGTPIIAWRPEALVDGQQQVEYINTLLYIFVSPNPVTGHNVLDSSTSIKNKADVQCCFIWNGVKTVY